MSIDWLKTVLRGGYQRQRAGAVLELAIRQPGTPLFNVKAPWLSPNRTSRQARSADPLTEWGL
jgi:hypothetical protein